MAISYTISRNVGAAQPLAAWGIVRPTLAYRTQTADVLSFEITSPTAATDDPVFDLDDILTLRRGGVIVFVGAVRSIDPVGEAAHETLRFTVLGPWQYLDRLNYLTTWGVYSYDGGTANTETTANLPAFQLGGAAADPETAGGQIAAILDYVVDELPEGLLVAGEIDAALVPPRETITNATCGDAVRRLLGRFPDHVTWFRYSGAQPVLDIRGSANLSTVELAVGGDTLQGLQSLRKHPDRQPPHVKIYWVAPVLGADGADDTRRIVRTTRYPSTSATNVGAIEFVLPLTFGEQLLDYADDETGIEEATLDDVLAADIYAGIVAAQWEGTITLTAAEPLGTRYMGTKINITGGRTEWATMNAIVQEESVDLESGTTTLRLGVARWLGPGDLREAINSWGGNRSATPTTVDPADRDDVGPAFGGSGGGIDGVPFSLKVCESGVTGYRNVYESGKGFYTGSPDY